jgi:DHA1 family multidrug resistance protein-like MFS transporter
MIEESTANLTSPSVEQGDDADFPASARRRNVLVTCLASAIASIGFLFVMPIFPLYIHTLIDGDLAEAAAWSGLAIGVSPLLSASTGPLWVWVGHRVGQKAMLMRSVAFIGFATALMAFATHPIHLVLDRIIIGLFGGIPVASMAAITASSRRHELGRAIAMLQSAQQFGPTLGPLLGGALATVFGFRASFVVAAGLFGMACIVTGMMYRNPPPVEASPRRAGEHSGARPRTLRFWAPLAALFTANFVDGSFMSLLPVVIGPLGAPEESLTLIAGAGVSFAGLAVVVAANIAGRLDGRIQAFTFIAPALAIAAVLVFGLLFVSVWWQFVAVRILIALVAGAVPTLAFSAAAHQAPASQRSTAVGVATSIGMLGWAASPYISGLMVGYGLHWLYAGAGIAMILAATLVWLAGRSTNHQAAVNG